MMNRWSISISRLVLAVAFAWLAALLLAFPVFAEGETPQPETTQPPEVQQELTEPAQTGEPLLPSETVESTSTPQPEATLASEATETPVATQTAPVEPEGVEETPLPTDVQPAIETPVVEESQSTPIEPTVEEQPEIQPILSGMGDPWFVSGRIKYRYLLTGGDCGTDPNCWVSATPITDAINAARTYLPDDRLIHVEGIPSGYSENVSIDGNDGSPNPLGSLKGLVRDGDAVVKLTGNLTVSDILTGFSLIGFDITGNVSFDNVTGTLALTDVSVLGGLDVTNQKGAVTLTNVRVSGSTDDGAAIDNSAVARAPVTIKNSSFQFNGAGLSTTAGLRINTSGAVTLSGVSASGNISTGANIVTTSSVSVINSAFINNTVATGDGGLGLSIQAGSTVSLNSVMAVNNTHDAIHIDTTGNVSIINVQANRSSSGKGLSICSGAACDASGAASVTISKSNFLQNHLTGLYVLTPGAITVSNVIANLNGNGLDEPRGGAYLDNCLKTGMDQPCTGSGNVTINASTFNENYGGDGLWVSSRGNIVLDGVSASDNQAGRGAVLDNRQILNVGGVVTISNRLGENHFDENLLNGLEILSNGAVTLTRVFAGSNDGMGASINNQGDRLSAVRITQGWFDDNASMGLSILTRGDVVLNTGSVSGNEGGGAGITDENAMPFPRSIVVSSYTFDDNNGGPGLLANARYNITLTNVSASGNTGDEANGVRLTSQGGNITINATGSMQRSFSENDGNGIHISTPGAVSINWVIASLNEGAGLYISTFPSAPSSVTMTYSILNNNAVMGANLSARGNITLTNVSASGNQGGSGVVANNAGAGTGTVNVVTNRTPGYGYFDGNAFAGLMILSNRAISVILRSASINGGAGLSLRNDSGTGNITVGAYGGRALLDGNHLAATGNEELRAGLEAHSNGAISLRLIQANDNDGEGVYLDNRGAVKPLGVTLTDVIANGNERGGVEIYSKGAVTVRSLTALNNSIENTIVSYNEQVNDLLEPLGSDTYRIIVAENTSYTFSVSSTHFDVALSLLTTEGVVINYASGTESEASLTFPSGLAGEFWLQVLDESVIASTGGAYSLTLGTPDDVVDDPYRNGLTVDNCQSSGEDVPCAAASPVSITNGNFGGNGHGGVNVLTGGAVTMTDIAANINGGTGVQAVVHMNSQPVTFTRMAASDNFANGVDVSTTGRVTWTTGSASGNASNGATIHNEAASTAQPVTLKSVTLNSNSQSGLFIQSKGAISLSTTSASGNLSTGARLDNCLYNGVPQPVCGNPFVSGVTLNGASSQFNNNQLGGLVAITRGNVAFTNVSASNNQFGSGASIDNSQSAYTAVVTVQSTARGAYSDFDANDMIGLQITTNGVIRLNRVSAQGNLGSNGAYLSNAPDTAGLVSTARPVSVTGSVFNRNSAEGLLVLASGAVTINQSSAISNSGVGMRVVSTTYAGQAVSVLRSVVQYNQMDGLNIQNRGVITLNGVTAMENVGGSGAVLSNLGEETDPVAVVQILSSQGANRFNGNAGSGLVVQASGSITASNIEASLNYGGRGASLSSTLGAVSVATGRFEDNNEDGLYMEAATTMLSSGVISFGNGGNGLSLVAAIGFSPTARVINSAFHGNYGSGILSGFLPVTLSNVTYFGNDLDGSGHLDWE